MSHSLSSQVHSTTAASASNVSPLHHSGSTTVKVAPRSVLVNWSESSRLNEGEEFPFDIFEAISTVAVSIWAAVAMSVGLRVTVFVCSSTRYRLRKMNRRIGILLTPKGENCSPSSKHIS